MNKQVQTSTNKYKQVQTSTNKYKQVSLFLLYFLFLKPLLAQPPAPPLHNPLQFVNEQLREIFTPLYKPSPVMEYLYDMTGHVTDITYWKRICYDTSNTDNWYRLYWEHFYMAYDTTQLEHDEEIYEQVLNIHADTIPIGILDISYYKLKDDALSNSTYFDFNEINDLINNKLNRTVDPYEYNT